MGFFFIFIIEKGQPNKLKIENKTQKILKCQVQLSQFLIA